MTAREAILNTLPHTDLEKFIRECVEYNTITGCWIWCGPQDSRGYGRISIGNHLERTHRIAHELFIGPIPEGYEVDHLCKRPLCCCPNHLEAVTPLENKRRCRLSFKVAVRSKFRTHCKSGKHEWIEENIQKRADGKSGSCRKCNMERSKARNYAQKPQTNEYSSARWAREKLRPDFQERRQKYIARSRAHHAKKKADALAKTTV